LAFARRGRQSQLRHGLAIFGLKWVSDGNGAIRFGLGWQSEVSWGRFRGGSESLRGSLPFAIRRDLHNAPYYLSIDKEMSRRMDYFFVDR